MEVLHSHWKSEMGFLMRKTGQRGGLGSATGLVAKLKMSRHDQHFDIYHNWKRHVAIFGIKCRHKILVPTNNVSPKGGGTCVFDQSRSFLWSGSNFVMQEISLEL